MSKRRRSADDSEESDTDDEKENNKSWTESEKVSIFIISFHLNQNHLNGVDFQVQIMQRCLENPRKLFEKFSLDLDRKSQTKAWANIMNQLKMDGIKIGSDLKLKQNVKNWVRRAMYKRLGATCFG